jgi:2-polyprenyl-3-methyl-5-hydroxy-6-metoxy-1,4-benzoquinol methylase
MSTQLQNSAATLSFLAELRQEVRARIPAADELGGWLETAYGEAVFGATILAEDLTTLPRRARVLDVGAGSMLLSCALERAGVQVTALEPVAPGFSHLDRLRAMVLDVAAGTGSVPRQLRIPAEALAVEATFDYAFSINVMEHVDNVALVIARVLAALRPGGVYRFVCPNYLFPYEPHFDIPTLFSKALTERVFRRRISRSERVIEPLETWRGLNWISVPSIRRVCSRLHVVATFDRQLLVKYVGRALNDPEFQRRRHPLLRAALTVADRCHIVHALGWLPVSVQPALSCRIERPDESRHSRTAEHTVD